MDYTPDLNGLLPILRSPQMKTMLRLQAVQATSMAKALAPKRSGAFAASIKAVDGNTIETLNQFGRVTRRAAMYVVATSPDALTVEFGAKSRYSRGFNREGHHVLGAVAKVLSQAHALRVRQALAAFAATGIQARPGSPGSPPVPIAGESS